MTLVSRHGRIAGTIRPGRMRRAVRAPLENAARKTVTDRNYVPT